MKKSLAIFFVALMLLCGFQSVARTIDLAGIWNVRLADDSVLHAIALPGTTDDACLGQPDTLPVALEKPQLLHLTRNHRFVGPARYSRSITVPADMAGKPLRLTLERVMWRSCLEIDGVPTGDCQESLSTPHSFLIPDGLSAGEHKIDLSIDNSKQYEISTKNLAHAYTDDTQIMWNGVLGDMRLEVVPEIEIAAIRVFPDIRQPGLRVEADIINHLSKSKKAILDWTVNGFKDAPVLTGKTRQHLSPGNNFVEINVADPRLGASLWSEFNPEVLSFSLSAGKDAPTVSTDFGMREISQNGRQILVNGSPVFLRGTLECCVFPLTGTPATTEEGWAKTFETARNWGLNHLRFHSWCPPEAAFHVADRMGFYLQVECPLWSVDIETGDEGANGAMKRYVKDEFDRIVASYGNHPSLCLMTVGNELQHDFDWLNEMTAHMHRVDPRRLYAATSFTFEKGHGGHAEPNDDFIVTQWTDDGWVRGQGVFDAEPPTFNRNYASATERLTVPLVEHEIGQYAVYPDLSEIDRYTGNLNPLNFKAIKQDLEAKGRLNRAPDYLRASGKLAAILYKEEIERALKTPGTAGIQLLGLQDFPGQGTALVGLVNAFWESKGVADADWFRQFCSPIVPLADFSKAVYTWGEDFDAQLSVVNYSPVYSSAEALWTLADGDSALANGRVALDSLLHGLNSLGTISVPLSGTDKARKLTLRVELPALGASNSWNIWVYPEKPMTEVGEVVATRSLSEALSALEAGKKVLFSPSPDSIQGRKSKFVPVFWSPVHFPAEAGGMGVLCDPSHPALQEFPNDSHSDWQWWHPVKNSKTVNISTLDSVQPIIEMVDNFTTNDALALMFEARVGTGTLMFSAIDLLNPAVDDPATRQILSSVLSYMNSPAFAPTGTLSIESLQSLLK